MTEDEGHEKVLDSIHTRDRAYCVDIVHDGNRFSLQTCRRDEERWQVIGRPGEYTTREDAIASARAIIARLE